MVLKTRDSVGGRLRKTPAIAGFTTEATTSNHPCRAAVWCGSWHSISPQAVGTDGARPYVITVQLCDQMPSSIITDLGSSDDRLRIETADD